jgi:hypothetical protein
MIRHIPLDSPWLPQQLHVRLSAPQSMSDGAEVPPTLPYNNTYRARLTHVPLSQPLFPPTAFQFFECLNDSRLTMWEEATHVLPEPGLMPLLAAGATIRFHTRAIPAGTSPRTRRRHICEARSPNFLHS